MVDLPPPLGPTSPTSSPGWTSNETPRRICLTPSYANVTLSNVTRPLTGERRTDCGASFTSGSLSSTSNTRCADDVARLIVRTICPITSIGATNIVVYSRNDTNTPADSGWPLPNKRGTARIHTSTVVACTANMSDGQN